MIKLTKKRIVITKASVGDKVTFGVKIEGETEDDCFITWKKDGYIFDLNLSTAEFDIDSICFI